MAKVTLDQWRMLHAVVEHGGFAQAAEALFKSQSTISYAVTKLQQQLGIDVLEVKGRKAELTEAGKVLLRRSQTLIDEAENLEKVADSLSKGWEGSITLVVDAIFPYPLLESVLKEFSPNCRHSRLELVESVLSGTNERLISGEADLVITGMTPPGFLGEPILEVHSLPVASPEHPLHQLDRELTNEDLKKYRQIVLRDSGVKQNLDAGWLGSEERWTVSHISTSKSMIRQGLGFAWLPAPYIQPELDKGELLPLKIGTLQKRSIQLFMIFPDPDSTGPATSELAQIFRKKCIAAQQV